MSQHHSPRGVFYYVAESGGAGARVGGCQSVAIFHRFLGAMAGPADRPALGTHLFPAQAAIVRLRHSRSGLLLSELGAHILSPAQVPAGTKRLSNLLRSPK